jgi:hypothetical protein
MRVPGVRGESEYEPGARTFRIRIYRGEELEFETEFLYGTTGKAGDFIVRVPSLMHAGRIAIVRYGYERMIVGGAVVVVVLLVLRLILRPVRIRVWQEGEETFFSTRNRRLKQSLRGV